MTTGLVLLAGLLVSFGLVSVVVALLPATPRLGAALDRIDVGHRPAEDRLADVGPVASGSERLGAYLYRHAPFPLPARQRRLLKLQDKSVAEFYADKAVLAAIGLVLPLFLGLIAVLVGQGASPVPLIAALAGAAVGWFVPDLMLRRAGADTQSTAIESLLTFIDLVTLERLANASASQALANAASLSEVALFTQIRSALERARLEQQSPYAELRRLAEQLDLPELVDVADVMQLDESGAALSGTLRARVKELRDAHLSKEQVRATAAAEGMTIYMTIPAMIFALIFLVAALLKLVFPG